MLHDFSDKEYWRSRWNECFPATYPPELRSYKLIVYERELKFLWFVIGKETIYHDKAVCARCGEVLLTGHYCKDL